MPRYLPKPGVIVPNINAHYQPIPETGIFLSCAEEFMQYWANRIEAGDIILVPDTIPATTQPPPTKNALLTQKEDKN